MIMRRVFALALLALGCGGNNELLPGVCGDGVVDPGEACDDGAGNSDTAPDACRIDCSLPRCGDGVRDTGERCFAPRRLPAGLRPRALAAADIDGDGDLDLVTADALGGSLSILSNQGG